MASKTLLFAHGVALFASHITGVAANSGYHENDDDMNMGTDMFILMATLGGGALTCLTVACCCYLQRQRHPSPTQLPAGQTELARTTATYVAEPPPAMAQVLAGPQG